jgi:hypothetical protein
MITTIVFSKNRACQLDLLLRSLSIPVCVLYTYNSEFEAGYNKLIDMYPKVNFIKQKDFKKDLLKIIEKSKYVLFLTDDDVMVDPFHEDCSEFIEFKDDPEILSLSLGLSSNVASQKWRWGDYHGNYRLRMWGYPMSVDSCIFRKEDIFDTILNNKMSNPNYLETALNLNIPDRPLMMCFDTPKIINNSVNQVQRDFPAHTSGPTAQELEKIFLSGKRLSLQDMKEKAKRARTYRMKEKYLYEIN